MNKSLNINIVYRKFSGEFLKTEQIQSENFDCVQLA